MDPWADLKDNLVKFAKLHCWEILPDFQSVNVAVSSETFNLDFISTYHVDFTRVLRSPSSILV